MGKLLIKNSTVVLQDRLLKNYSVICKDEKISLVAPDHELRGYQADNIIDASGCYLVPGLIDLHCHGLHHFLIDYGSDHLANIRKTLPQYGVTSFLPTVCPLPPGKDEELLSSLAGVQSEGAAILGFHLEGPFLTLTGALPLEAIGKPNAKRALSLIKASHPYRAIFSVSPELEGVTDLIPIMAKDNNPVFLTHTAANVTQTQEAIEAGVCHATHFYDVFPCPPEKDPGVRPCGAVEAVFADPRVSVDFILDGEHVDPVVVKMALECKGSERVCLITDANLGAGLPPGQYKGINDSEIEFAYEGAPARMTKNTPLPGHLAGSGLTLDRAIRNAINLLGVDLPQAVSMVTSNPAKVLGISNTKGQIKKGYDADIALFDEKIKVVSTWVKGKCCFTRNT